MAPPFDRIVVINLDSRADRLAAFERRAIGLRSLEGWVRQRAVAGDVVGMPGYFRSGGGAWGCARSHVRVIESALMDGVETLLVLEDDCRFVPDFDARLEAFLRAVPDDWSGAMLGGQNHKPPEPVAHGVGRSLDTQRTHAYAVRGKASLRALYKLWSRADRHIDHLLGQWQAKVPVYQPDPFLCGQDAGKSDINGRREGVRFWSPPDPAAPVYLLDVPRHVADDLYHLGAEWGDEKAAGRLAKDGWPAARLAKWADELVAAADAPCLRVAGAEAALVARQLSRPAVVVRADTTGAAAAQMPPLHPRYRAGRVTWLLAADPPPDWPAGRPPVRDRLNRLVAAGDYRRLPEVVRHLAHEARRVRGGRVLVAHAGLDVGRAMAALDGPCAQLVGAAADWADQVAFTGAV